MGKSLAVIFVLLAIFVFCNTEVFASHKNYNKKQIVTGYSRRAPIRRPHRMMPPPPPPLHRHHNHFDFMYNYDTPYYTGYQPLNYVPMYSMPYPVGYYGYPNNHVNLGFRVSI